MADDKIVSALGHEYPVSMMGFQAADMDAAVLAERQRHKGLRERAWRKLTDWDLKLYGPPRESRLTEPGISVYLHASCLVVTRTERLEGGGTRAWYPLHVRWGWSRRRKPHWRRRHHWGDR